MKKGICFFIAVLSVISALANTYYSTNGLSPNLTSTWHTSRNGTGSTPSNFTSGDIFVVQASHYLTTTANWTISGTNSKVWVENGATLKADDKITVPTFQVDNGGTYIHNVGSNAFPGTNTRTFGATSTVKIWDWSGSTALPSPTTWGNLTLDVDNSYNSNWNQAGDLTSIAGNFTIISTGSSTKEFRLATNQDYTLTIGGDLIIQGGQLEAANSNTDAVQSIIINGSYNQSGGTFTRSDNNGDPMTIQFNGSTSSFTKSGGTLTNSYINWQVNSGKKLTLNNNFPVAIDCSFDVIGSLDCSNYAVTGLGDFDLNSTGTLITANTSGLIGSLSVSGLLNLTSGASYEFQTATSTPFPLLAGTIAAKNVIVGANVTINKNVNISGTLTLNTGKLTIPAGFTVNITSGNTIAGSGFSSSKHIVTQVSTVTGSKGLLRMGNMSGSVTFPIGNGTYYMPVILNAVGTNDFSVCVFQGATKNGEPNGTAISSTEKLKMVDAMWAVTRNSGSGSTVMQLAWPAALEGTTFQSFTDAQIGISYYGGSSWDLSMGSGSQSANTASRSGMMSFFRFGVSKVGIPLPLKFGNIKVYEQDKIVHVGWTSYTEINVDHYEIEYSRDGMNFSSTGRTTATGNNGSRADYDWTDINHFQDVSFYRIKAIDMDGQFSYSNIVKYNPGKINPDLVIYPNPVKNNRFSLDAGIMNKGQYYLSIYDMKGNKLYSQSIMHAGGALSQSIVLPANIIAGYYNLVVTGLDSKWAKSFIVQ